MIHENLLKIIKVNFQNGTPDASSSISFKLNCATATVLVPVSLLLYNYYVPAVSVMIVFLTKLC